MSEPKKYKTRHGKVYTVSSADKCEGFLIGSFMDTSARFRMYNPADKKDFKDYAIAHSDMQIKISDAGAYFYIDDDGVCWIDHSPEALGMEEA